METGLADEESPSSMNVNGAQMMVANYGHPPLSVIKVFSCKYCSRKFLNPRAFGGHQNAHKKERKIDMFICNHYKAAAAAAAAAQHASALDLNKPAAEELSTPSHPFKFSAGDAGQSHNLDLDLHL